MVELYLFICLVRAGVDVSLSGCSDITGKVYGTFYAVVGADCSTMLMAFIRLLLLFNYYFYVMLLLIFLLSFASIS